MDVHNRCSPRRLILRLAVPAGLALMAMLAPSLVAAQGTPQQRAACEDEAKWLCSNYFRTRVQSKPACCEISKLSAPVAGRCLARRAQRDVNDFKPPAIRRPRQRRGSGAV
jgi:hypothetical protein